MLSPDPGRFCIVVVLELPVVEKVFRNLSTNPTFRIYIYQSMYNIALAFKLGGTPPNEVKSLCSALGLYLYRHSTRIV
jgi:hypothetical protein